MFFNQRKFSNGLKGYAYGLKSMLEKSWSAAALKSSSDPDDRISFWAEEENESHLLLRVRAVTRWFHWQPESLATWLIKWLIVPELLIALCIYTMLGVIFKICLWTLGLVPAVIILFLLSVRLRQPSRMT